MILAHHLGFVDVQNLPLNKTIKATEGSGFEVLNIQPSIKAEGCIDPNSCSYNPSALVDDGSCTYLESKPIDGNINSGYLSTEVYTYPLLDGAQSIWQVIGGAWPCQSSILCIKLFLSICAG